MCRALCDSRLVVVKEDQYDVPKRDLLRVIDQMPSAKICPVKLTRSESMFEAWND